MVTWRSELGAGVEYTSGVMGLAAFALRTDVTADRGTPFPILAEFERLAPMASRTTIAAMWTQRTTQGRKQLRVDGV